VVAFQLAALAATVFLAGCAASGRLSFLRSEFDLLWRRAVALLLLVAVLAAVVFYPIAAGKTRDAFEIDEIWFPALFLGHGVLVLFLVAWHVLVPASVLRRDPATRRTHLIADVRVGAIAGIGGWVLTIAVTLSAALIATRVGLSPEPSGTIPPMIVWLAGLDAMRKLLVIAAAMLIEEAFFRGFLQTRFGLVLSTLLFTLAHANYGLPFMLIGVMTISLVIGRLYDRRRRLLPCIVAHGIFDAIQLLIVLPWAVRLGTAA